LEIRPRSVAQAARVGTAVHASKAAPCRPEFVAAVSGTSPISPWPRTDPRSLRLQLGSGSGPPGPAFVVSDTVPRTTSLRHGLHESTNMW